ncbi:integral membrane protein S linking to the trans Golgi network-domain-containing protein, partial [Zychaea mexicana]|uniref:integral membrane protein S linking to the trans Golgi network-domain-containing protein n=1 Tax=Zychaea mexicana TaxID=64656 RepID=UPI0022FEE780
AQSSFRATGWDPILIIAQIVSLQSLYYIFISLLLLIALALTGGELSLDAILDDSEIRTDTVFGWTLALVWLVNAAINISVLVFLVQRAKLVLDFVLTLHFIHTVFVWIHTGHFPTCGPWWVLQIMNAILMTLGGEWACMRREMEPI